SSPPTRRRRTGSGLRPSAPTDASTSSTSSAGSRRWSSSTSQPPDDLEVRSGAVAGPVLRPWRQAAALELLELGPGRHLLREQRGLDPVEEAFEPTHELGLSH